MVPRPRRRSSLLSSSISSHSNHTYFAPKVNATLSEDEVNVYLSMLQDQMPPIMPSFSKSVVVVGAGLAGLATARECRKAGMDVTILESEDRAGGRCFTMTSPEHFSDGIYGEAGGMVSPNAAPRTLQKFHFSMLTLASFVIHTLSTTVTAIP